MTKSWPCWVVALVILLFMACGDDGGSGPLGNLCENYMNELRSCGLLTEGRGNCDDAEPPGPYFRCQWGCLLDANCDDLEVLVCQDHASANLEQCFSRCLEAHHFDCADGSDQIPPSWQCDGTEDCADGSDEQECPPGTTFECADGSDTIPLSWQCDGTEDCADGSDEQECPPGTTFECADGSDSIPSYWVCDFEEDCNDGSDEAGCAQLICN